MEELIWVGVAIALALGLKWWQKRKGKPAEPPGAVIPPPEPDDPPVTLPFEPPKADEPPAEPAPKPPLGRLRDWLRKRREAKAEAQAQIAAAIDDPDKKTERGYQLDIIAHLQGQGVHATAEFVLPDGARVDISTPSYAIEVDFAKKWAECVGQALYYALVTGKKPVCLLLIGVEDKEPGLARLRAVCKRERIDVWTYHVKTRTLTILGVE